MQEGSANALALIGMVDMYVVEKRTKHRIVVDIDAAETKGLIRHACNEDVLISQRLT